MKVSAIVPVYNPGDDIDDCIRTLLDQSLPAEEYEVIFVDDGSTDATPERLDRLAAEHPNVRVEHIPNSGWPGRPRNVGIDMARGEFVYFVDNDDWLGGEALERLHDRAVADDADVVIGKVVGSGPGKNVPKGLFRQNRAGLTFDWAPLLWLLSPHKLFRRSLLDEHGIRFPEGRRRLEDHVFVVHAYFHAQGRISVLADYTCYHWTFRRPDANASIRPFDPAAYYANVREVLDLIDEHTEPGELRDRLYAHWYGGKMLGRVGAPNFVKFEPEYRRERYEEIRRLALERFDPRLDARVPFNLRLRARLLRDGDYDALVALAEREMVLKATARLEQMTRDGDDLLLRFRTGLEMGDGDRDLVVFDRDGDRLLWHAPEGLGRFSHEERDATERVMGANPYVFVRSLADGSDFALPIERETVLVRAEGVPGCVRPVVDVTARVSARTGAAGSPLPAGEWEVLSRPSFGGFKATARLRGTRRADRLVLQVTPDGRLDVQRPPLRRRVADRLPALARLLRRAGRRARRLRRTVRPAAG